MISPPPIDLPDYFLQALARALPALVRLGKRTVLYPAGPLSAALLESGRLGDLPVVGIADRDPSRFMDGIAGHSVMTPSALFRGGVDAILICSITYHAEIFEELLTSCIKYGIDLIDLCRAAPDTTVDAGLSALAHRTPPSETVQRPISFVLAASDHGMMIVNRQDRHAHYIGAIAGHRIYLQERLGRMQFLASSRMLRSRIDTTSTQSLPYPRKALRTPIGSGEYGPTY